VVAVSSQHHPLVLERQRVRDEELDVQHGDPHG